MIGNTTQCSYLWGSEQDFCKSGTLFDQNGSFDYMIIADGHGQGNILSCLKSDDFPWRDVFNPAYKIYDNNYFNKLSYLLWCSS